MLNKSLEIKHEARPTAAELLVHPWMAARPPSLSNEISETHAQATMAAAHASAQKGIAGFASIKAAA
jgi:hypothetical protein